MTIIVPQIESLELRFLLNAYERVILLILNNAENK